MSNKPSVTKPEEGAPTLNERPDFDPDTGFCIATGSVRIENNTDALINLVPVCTSPKYPKGVKLWPGLTTVPMQYWVALLDYNGNSHISVSEDDAVRATYKPSKRSTGRDGIDQLLEVVWYSTANGRVRGPRITVYRPEQIADREDGPRFPDSLDEYSEITALELIKNVSRKSVLESWLSAEHRRQPVRQALLLKLAQS